MSHASRNIFLKIFFLEIYWTVSHAACSADSCQCSRKNRYCQLNNGFPKFFVFHDVVV